MWTRRESRPMLYRMARFVIGTALRVFFSKIDVRHGDVVPDRGPVVFVANHPNSIMDPLVLGAVTKRKVNYIAHAGLFRNPLIRWFLRGCGVIPVYRRQDDPDKMDQNVRMFEECTNALEKGETIGIFPEGTSDVVRKVKKVKTGAARIVLETEAKHDFQLGVKLIPVGLHFYSISHFRSRVLVNFGEPIELEPYFEKYRAEGFEGVKALTAEIEKRLMELTVNVRDEELDQFVYDIEQIYKDELRTIKGDGKTLLDKAYREQFVISKAIAECVQYYHDHDPQRLDEMREKVAAYKRKLKKLHLRDAMLRESVSPRDIWKQAGRAYALAILGFVPALYGIINNFIPYRIAEMCGRHFLYERTKILSALLIGGGAAFLFFYAVQTAVVTQLTTPLIGLAYLVSLPVFGFFALAYIQRLRELNKKISFSFFLFTNRPLIARMRRQRRMLIQKMNEIRDEYLKIIQNQQTAKKQPAV